MCWSPRDGGWRRALSRSARASVRELGPTRPAEVAPCKTRSPIARRWYARPTGIAFSPPCSRRPSIAARSMRSTPSISRSRACARVVREPLAGEIRLQWWNDAIEGKAAGEVAANPVAAALLESVARYRLPAELLTGLIAARRFDLYDDPMLVARRLRRLCGRHLIGGHRARGPRARARLHARPRPARASCRSRLRDRRPAAGLSRFTRRAASCSCRSRFWNGTACERQNFDGAGRRRRSCAPPWPSCGGEAREHLAQAGRLAEGIADAVTAGAAAGRARARRCSIAWSAGTTIPSCRSRLSQLRRQWRLWRAARRPARIFA